MRRRKLQELLEQKALGMVFDIDGTLSPFAPTSKEARLHPRVVPLLEKMRENAHVAILTGRSIQSGARMVNVDGLIYIGTHGLEWSHGLPWLNAVTVEPEALAYIEPAKEVLKFAEEQLADEAGILVEHKLIGGTVHYRLAPDPIQARQKILSVLEGPAALANIRISEGTLTTEVRAPVRMDKGQALRRFVEDRSLQGVLFAGDDITDLDAIRELAQLRQEGRVTLGIVVQYPTTAPEMLERADIVVQGVEGMVQLLCEIEELM